MLGWTTGHTAAIRTASASLGASPPTQRCNGSFATYAASLRRRRWHRRRAPLLHRLAHRRQIPRLRQLPRQQPHQLLRRPQARPCWPLMALCGWRRSSRPARRLRLRWARRTCSRATRPVWHAASATGFRGSLDCASSAARPAVTPWWSQPSPKPLCRLTCSALTQRRPQHSRRWLQRWRQPAFQHSRPRRRRRPLQRQHPLDCFRRRRRPLPSILRNFSCSSQPG